MTRARRISKQSWSRMMKSIIGSVELLSIAPLIVEQVSAADGCRALPERRRAVTARSALSPLGLSQWAWTLLRSRFWRLIRAAAGCSRCFDCEFSARRRLKISLEVVQGKGHRGWGAALPLR
jgi:hypothetical protein